MKGGELMRRFIVDYLTFLITVLERHNFVYSDPSSPFAGHADTRVDQRSLAK
ncbi:hypothetical protein Bca101_072738 [Brassica carinata]